VHRHRLSVGQHRGSAAKRDSMKNRPPWTPTYKISALRQLHPLVVRRRHSRTLTLVGARIPGHLPIDPVLVQRATETTRKDDARRRVWIDK
jgi:hypothetical protein